MKTTSIMIVAIVLSGCTGEGEGEEDGGGSVADARCATGLRWAGGDAESPLMHPGRDCIACHASGGEGPRFTIAGTVHAAIDDPDDCYGVPGVNVTVTDANGQAITLTTNEAGNFYSRAALVMPIHARLELAGNLNAMTFTPQVGACASCHTQTGASNAPGRIVAPMAP